MPLECPTPGPGGIFRLCSDPTLAPCLGECEAIKAELPYYADGTCPG
ncbi:MAG: hypothetical protein IT373_38540 [Polyangiaceae bacterium]|nr:hypothetical protein [Polyangiaceae bacterium]